MPICVLCVFHSLNLLKKEGKKKKEIKYKYSGTHLYWEQSPFLREPALRWGRSKPCERCCQGRIDSHPQSPSAVLAQHSPTFTGCLFQPLCSKSLTSASFHSWDCYSNNPLFSVFSPFSPLSVCILKPSLTSPRYYVLALKLQPSLYKHIQLLFSSSELFWSREYSVFWGELCTFSALGTGVISMIYYLPNVPVISLLWIDPDLDNWLVLMWTEEK